MRINGVYDINPDGLGSFQVRCDMSTDRSGWTVIQRRRDGSQNFRLGWSDYKAGFGDLDGEFLLGLGKIHRLSKSGQNVLRVDLMDFGNAEAYAKYGTFSVADESDKYRLNVGSFSGKRLNSYCPLFNVSECNYEKTAQGQSHIKINMDNFLLLSKQFNKYKWPIIASVMYLLRS